MATALATETGPAYILTQACWPIIEYVLHFSRQVKHGGIDSPEQVRFEALAAFRTAEEMAREDSTAEKLWFDYAKAMMAYFVDYKFVLTDWSGKDFWFDNRFELDPQVLGHNEALGGDKFFEDCDEVQKTYDEASRRERPDRHAHAELLNLYFACLRLGFKGRYEDNPHQLNDYTRQLFARLPGNALTRGKEMFPETYRHNQELKVDYQLGVKLSIVLTTFALIIGAWLLTSKFLWDSKVKTIQNVAEWFAKPDNHESVRLPREFRE